MVAPLLGFLLIVVFVILIFLLLRLNKLGSQHRTLSQEHSRLVDRFRSVLDLEVEKQRILEQFEQQRRQLQDDIARTQAQHAQVTLLQQEQHHRSTAEIESFQSNINRLRLELNLLDEEANLQSFGFYKPRYDFASSDRYQSALEPIREKQKQLIKNGGAAICSTEWTVNGNRTEGRKQTNQTLKLILRAFNGESDAAIAKVTYNNVGVMEARIRKAWEVINNLVGVQQCTITSEYLNLKLQELFLVHEYQEKVQAEKEEQRRIREQMREEEIAQRELEKARQEAEREERRYADALAKARQEIDQAVGARHQKLLTQIEALQQKLQEAQSNKERAIARAQMTRSGPVYVISNIGSFGESVFKIGMTRRLDPLDRVRELGDASVPFQFDVHAIIYSEDAPKLETTLHRAFQHCRINRVNERKEFFNVTIDEITKVVRQHHGEIEITQLAEAKEYRQSVAKLHAIQTGSVSESLSVA
jgi:hypothetical protein